MSVSRQEEIIAVLWLIAALTALGHGFTFFGWLCACKAASDTAISIYCAIKEIRAEKNAAIDRGNNV